MNYRVLYFFDGQEIVVLSHVITKEDVVLSVEIRRAKNRRTSYLSDREGHRVQLELG